MIQGPSNLSSAAIRPDCGRSINSG
jgi:hypothetical protein